MCVILACAKRKPTMGELRDAERSNPDGGGVMWLEGGTVRWSKSLDSDEVFQITERAALPFVVHFRIASVGGVSDALCHPVPMTPDCTTDNEGKAKSALAHNGTWGEWKGTLHALARRSKRQVPGGEWSDSRAMAWIAGVYGRQMLDLVAASHQKIAVLSRHGIELWGRWDEEDGIWMSNTYFKRRWVEAPRGGYQGRLFEDPQHEPAEPEQDSQVDVDAPAEQPLPDVTQVDPTEGTDEPAEGASCGISEGRAPVTPSAPFVRKEAATGNPSKYFGSDPRNASNLTQEQVRDIRLGRTRPITGKEYGVPDGYMKIDGKLYRMADWGRA